VIDILFKSLKGTDWELLTSFVSPVFFEVVPTIGMARVFGAVVKDYTNAKEFERVRTAANENIDKINLNQTKKLQLVKNLSHVLDSRKLGMSERQEFGQVILKIYFSQIFSGDKSILDLRSSAFNDLLEWSPKPVYFEWNRDFRDGLQGLYRGFYTNDEQCLNEGLKKLNLLHAKAVIYSHFGEGQQDAVRFSLNHFKKSLHAVFVSCKENRSRLHPDFFALGVYLLCLYENLESLDCSFDVRRAFLEVTSQ
jgi:hypothetical protein